jgi:VanZ family protein
MHRKIDTYPRKSIFYWILTLSYMGIIFYLSSLERTGIPELFPLQDKTLHAILYIILAFLIYRSLDVSGNSRYVFILSFLFAAIYGITDEIHQAFVPGREASLGDIAADSIGALLGCFLSKIVKLYKHTK